MSESNVKKCPKCGGEMEKGYIITDAIRWSEKKHTQWALGQELIVPVQLLAIPNVEAYRCTSCKLVLFHYGPKRSPPSETPKHFLKKCVGCDEIIPIASEYCPKCGTKQKEKEE